MRKEAGWQKRGGKKLRKRCAWKSESTAGRTKRMGRIWKKRESREQDFAETAQDQKKIACRSGKKRTKGVRTMSFNEGRGRAKPLRNTKDN